MNNNFIFLLCFLSFAQVSFAKKMPDTACANYHLDTSELLHSGLSTLVPEEIGDEDITVKKDMLYQKSQGWNDKFSRLDIYYHNDLSQSRKNLKPSIVFVHGGGWVEGDKSNVARNRDLARFFVKKGFVFISINIRLYKNEESKNATYKDQVADIARSVKWLKNNIRDYGGRPDDFVLVGFSSGAHLVALAGTDQKYFKKENLSFDILKGVISMDVPQYDVPLSLELLKGTYLDNRQSFIKGLFGDSVEAQKEGSPVEYVKDAKIKPFLLISTGSKDGQDIDITRLASLNFKNRMISENHSVRHFHFPERGHTSLVMQLGQEGDAVTQLISSFLDRIYQKDERKLNKSLLADAERAISKRIEGLLNSQKSFKNVSGALVGVVSPELSLIRGCGTATDHSFFSIGSVSKAFAGLLVAQAEIDGKIKIEQPVVQYLPEPLKNFLDKSITVKELLTHTSGLPNFPENMSPGDEPGRDYSMDQLKSCFKDSVTCKVNSAKRGKYNYSNLGVGLLGIALAQVYNNSSFAGVVNSHLKIPFEMDELYANASEFLLPQILFDKQSGPLAAKAADLWKKFLVNGYNFSDSEEGRILSYPSMGVLAASGEMIVSGQTMSQFMSLLVGLEKPMKPLTARALEKFTNALYRNSESHSLAYAIDVHKLQNGKKIYSKLGSTKGYSSVIIWSPDSRLGLYILANRGKVNGLGSDIGKNLFKDLSQILLKNY